MRRFLRFSLLDKRDLLILAFACLISLGTYLFASRLYFRIGFPLDDSWIHLTYARNLVTNGEWAFQPGLPSAGSTSPLWTGLLALGFLTSLAPYLWTYFLGGLILFGLGWLGEYVVRALRPDYHPRLPWVGLFIVAEWHMIWSAASGMETLLHAFLITASLGMLITHSRRFLAMGMLAGLGIWIRPDAATLLI